MIDPSDAPAFLAWLQARRSTRVFTDAPVPRAVLARLIEAAISAPSNTNRQPWRFAVVRAPALRTRIAEAVRAKADEIKAIIARGHHAEDYGSYGDFFHEPLANATAIIVPQYRSYPDLIANFIASGGGDPAQYATASAMQAELCSTCAAVMTLLTQAHAEGLGACWMAGPMIARDEIQRTLGIEAPWQMVGAVALGYPATASAAPPRKPIDRVATWFEDDTHE
ncbi:MAG: nitroreductase family protein [Deltaproteobacteria bacterium]|nr:nitroreductase family protein [Deltaproteobacteria bacterium]